MIRAICSFAVIVLSSSLAFADGSESIHQILPGGPAGVCSIEQWRADWPGCLYEDGVKEGHLSVVHTNSGPAYRVEYAVGEIGPERGGVGWRYPINGSNSAELCYTLKFSRDFDWVKGGKLPGLCGGPESVTGGNPANGKNGFSVRLMWRAEGRGEAYVYHMHQPTEYGESFPFPSDFRFPTAEELRIRMRVLLNTPGQHDGRLDVWIRLPHAVSETHVVARSAMEWRSDPNVFVDGLLFETFHGGGDKTWSPRRPSTTTFSDIYVDLLRPENGR